jgi:hypothetical protein
MDAGHIMVAVLTTAAVGLAIWAEIHSRRNPAVQNNSGSTERLSPRPNRTNKKRDEPADPVVRLEEPRPTSEPRESPPVPVYGKAK